MPPKLFLSLSRYFTPLSLTVLTSCLWADIVRSQGYNFPGQSGQTVITQLISNETQLWSITVCPLCTRIISGVASNPDMGEKPDKLDNPYYSTTMPNHTTMVPEGCPIYSCLTLDPAILSVRVPMVAKVSSDKVWLIQLSWRNKVKKCMQLDSFLMQ